MTKVHCFTSASFAYIDRVLVLSKTVKEFHPDWEFWLCLVDQPHPEACADNLICQLDRVVNAEELQIPNFKQWAFCHDIVELCTAVKGRMLEHILSQEEADKVFYIDPDIALFGPLSEALDLLETQDILLTPHQLTPESDKQAIIDNEIGSLKYGIYNLGFLGLRNGPEARRFAKWWSSRLLEFCYDDVPGGLFTDQKWCDHVPAFFDNVAILKHSGYNVASWNLSNRIISINDEGTILVNGQELKFYHFTKIDRIGETMIERYCNGSVAVFELLVWYRKKLGESKIDGFPDRWWAYGSYTDGSPILYAERRYYRDNDAIRLLAENPFSSGKIIKSIVKTLQLGSEVMHPILDK
ncbi:hypothetical protein [Methylobacterium sp. CM6246]